MKLSDIDDMKKVAAEYKMFRDFISKLRNSRLEKITIEAKTMTGPVFSFEYGVRGTISMLELDKSIAEALHKHLKVLQTKLVMYGVDEEFEDLTP